ncbi:unnamed protein product [Prunus brigantina]
MVAALESLPQYVGKPPIPIPIPISTNKLLPSMIQAPTLELKPLRNHLKKRKAIRKRWKWKTNLFAPRPISISVHLTSDEKASLIALLKEFRYVFAWSYEEMPGLNPSLVSHTLNIELGTKPIVQPRRNFHPEIEKQIKVEIEKLLAAGFIKPIKHPTWLANIVPVKKKTGVIRICTDYRDLNRACPKDEFPLPNMDILIDSTSGQGLLSFMDGFSGYNQIKMSPKDAEKTAFRTPYGNFYYTVMPFGLKNAGATYQRAMTAVFHDMMGKEVEDYVDDLVVKSKTR